MDNLAEEVTKLVEHYKLQERILVSSFNPLALSQIHRILPTVPVGLLASPGISGAWARSFIGRWLPFQAIHPGRNDTNHALIQKWQNHGFRVHAYTINDRKTMMKFFSWNIDGIITDDVPLARQVVISMEKNKTYT
jgi:glycerophosphoryl diester phosphodiesterase